MIALRLCYVVFIWILTVVATQGLASTAPSMSIVTAQDAGSATSTDLDGIRRIYGAFDAGRYEDTICVCKQVLSRNIDPDSRMAVEDLLLIAYRRAFGYNRAVAEAQTFRINAMTLRPNSTNEIMLLDGIISHLKSSQIKFGKSKAVSKPAKAKPVETALEKAYAAKAVYRLAEVICLQCNDQVAIGVWRKIVLKCPGTKQDFVARANIAAIFEKLRDIENAKKVWLRGAMFAPDSDFAALCIKQLARLHTSDKTYLKGARELLNLVKSNLKAKSASLALTEAAKLFRLSMDNKSALAAYLKVVGRAANDQVEAETIVAIRDIFLEQNKPDDAVSFLIRIMSKDSNPETQARALLALGELYREQKKPDLELNAFTSLANKYRGTKAYIDARSVLVRLSEEYSMKAYECQHKWDPVHEYYYLQAAFNLENDDLKKNEMRLRMANVLKAQGYYIDAQKYLTEILSDTSEACQYIREIAEFQQAQICYISGDRESASQHLRSIVSTCQS